MARKMDEALLLKVLKEEEADSASYYDSEIAKAQADAMDRFHAKPYGDEVEGRSRVVTHDVEDTINWIMPGLMRAFQRGDGLITCDDPALDDGDQTLKEASDYLSHVLFADNPGETVIYDFAFDALLQKLGVLRCYWKDPEPKPPKIIEGVTPEQLDKYTKDPEYEILSQQEDTKTIEGQPYQCFSLMVQQKPKIGRACIEAVPPEEFRVSRRARSIKEADYHGWKQHCFLAEIIREHPDKAAELDPGGNYVTKDDDTDVASDARASARFPDEPVVVNGTDRASYSDVGRKKVWRMVEYIRCDYDGDGTVELRRVCRVGDVILENDAMDESEFVVWTPIRIAHRMIGRSLADTLLDLQKIKTVLTRRALDSLGQSLMPRTVVNEMMMASDGSTLDRILDHDVGSVIPVKGPVGEAIREVVTPDVSPQALQALEFFDRRSEEATGVNRHAMGIQPQAITETKGGIEMLQAAANSRVEQIGRWLSFGLQEALEKLLRLLAAHQDGPRMVKIKGKRLQIDPRRWSDEMSVSVHVGMVAESRDRKMTYLGIIAGKQEQIIMKAGLDNPIAGVREYRNTLAQMVETMGFKSGGLFFKEIPENYQPPPPQPDPKTMEVQQKGQIAQAELVQKGQMQQAEMAGRMQLEAAKGEMGRQTAAQKIAADREAADAKLRSEHELAQLRIRSEAELAVMRMQAEMDLARWKAEQEFSLRERELAAGAKAKANGTDSGGIKDERPGGRLDA